MERPSERAKSRKRDVSAKRLTTGHSTPRLDETRGNSVKCDLFYCGDVMCCAVLCCVVVVRCGVELWCGVLFCLSCGGRCAVRLC
jgi:hypothetical protein